MSSRQEMVEQIAQTWEHHPRWTLGKMIQSAMNISRGEIRSNPALATDAEIMSGLRALIPEPDEGVKVVLD